MNYLKKLGKKQQIKLKTNGRSGNLAKPKS